MQRLALLNSQTAWCLEQLQLAFSTKKDPFRQTALLGRAFISNRPARNSFWKGQVFGIISLWPSCLSLSGKTFTFHRVTVIAFRATGKRIASALSTSSICADIYTTFTAPLFRSLDHPILDPRLKLFLLKVVSFSILRRNFKLAAFLSFCCGVLCCP